MGYWNNPSRIITRIPRGIGQFLFTLDDGVPYATILPPGDTWTLFKPLQQFAGPVDWRPSPNAVNHKHILSWDFSNQGSQLDPGAGSMPGRWVYPDAPQFAGLSPPLNIVDQASIYERGRLFAAAPGGVIGAAYVDDTDILVAVAYVSGIARLYRVNNKSDYLNQFAWVQVNRIFDAGQKSFVAFRSDGRQCRMISYFISATAFSKINRVTLNITTDAASVSEVVDPVLPNTTGLTAHPPLNNTGQNTVCGLTLNAIFADEFYAPASTDWIAFGLYAAQGHPGLNGPVLTGTFVGQSTVTVAGTWGLGNGGGTITVSGTASNAMSVDPPFVASYQTTNPNVDITFTITGSSNASRQLDWVKECSGRAEPPTSFTSLETGNGSVTLTMECPWGFEELYHYEEVVAYTESAIITNTWEERFVLIEYCASNDARQIVHVVKTYDGGLENSTYTVETVGTPLGVNDNYYPSSDPNTGIVSIGLHNAASIQVPGDGSWPFLGCQLFWDPDDKWFFDQGGDQHNRNEPRQRDGPAIWFSGSGINEQYVTGPRDTQVNPFWCRRPLSLNSMGPEYSWVRRRGVTKQIILSVDTDSGHNSGTMEITQPLAVDYDQNDAPVETTAILTRTGSTTGENSQSTVTFEATNRPDDPDGDPWWSPLHPVGHPSGWFTWTERKQETRRTTTEEVTYRLQLIDPAGKFYDKSMYHSKASAHFDFDTTWTWIWPLALTNPWWEPDDPGFGKAPDYKTVTSYSQITYGGYSNFSVADTLLEFIYLDPRNSIAIFTRGNYQTDQEELVVRIEGTEVYTQMLPTGLGQGSSFYTKINNPDASKSETGFFLFPWKRFPQDRLEMMMASRLVEGAPYLAYYLRFFLPSGPPDDIRIARIDGVTLHVDAWDLAQETDPVGNDRKVLKIGVL